MAAKAPISCESGSYTPFGPVTPFQVFNPQIDFADGLRYTGAKILGAEEVGVKAHAEHLSLINNLANQRATFDQYRAVVKMPIVRLIDGNPTSVADNTIAITGKVWRECNVAERERLFWLGALITASTVYQSMVKDGEVPY
jgi:hypothetical protein